MKRKKKKQKPTITQQRLVGIRVYGVSRVGVPNCYLIYEVWYSDGSTKFVRGKPVFGAAYRAVPKGEKDKTQRPDLFPVIVAAAHLIGMLENVCADLDDVKL
jgi:hypothetical protein